MNILYGEELSFLHKEHIRELFDSVGIPFEYYSFDEHIDNIYYMQYMNNILIACMIVDNDNIYFLAVHPKYQRKGYGTKLISILPYKHYFVHALYSSYKFWTLVLNINPFLHIEYLCH